jgi:hypothetical protein
MYRPILASLVAYGLYKTKRSFNKNDNISDINENDKEVKKVSVLRRV